MAPPTREKCDKRPRAEDIPEVMVVNQIAPLLWRWWRKMDGYDQRRVKDHLGYL
ncbi:hypothetical protein HAX54_039567, partial [Datura stramonium]|nr:hypothetical protein [Datura stramonium]